ncbi:hypothetical protein ES707_16983 [subsurface metagenome]
MQEAGLQRPRIFDMPDNLAEKAAFADRGHPHEQRAGSIDRASDNWITLVLSDWDRLAGNERLVDAGTAALNSTVSRDALAGPNTYEIADANFLDRHFDLLAVAHDASGLRLQIKEPLDGLGAARFHDERQPFRKNVIGADHY